MWFLTEIYRLATFLYLVSSSGDLNSYELSHHSVRTITPNEVHKLLSLSSFTLYMVSDL